MGKISHQPERPPGFEWQLEGADGCSPGCDGLSPLLSMDWIRIERESDPHSAVTLRRPTQLDTESIHVGCRVAGAQRAGDRAPVREPVTTPRLVYRRVAPGTSSPPFDTVTQVPGDASSGARSPLVSLTPP